MERSEFRKSAPGELVRIPEGHAFLPAPLPPNLKLTRSLMTATDRARGALSELVGQARLVQNLDLIMAPFQRREAVLSSRIEGTHTEVREVLLYEAGLAGPLEEDSDLYEVLNYLNAVRHGHEWLIDGRPFNLPLVRGLHSELMRGVRGHNKHPGEFRRTQVFLGDRGGGVESARFVPPPPEQVASLLDNMVQFTRDEMTYGALVDSAILHYQFETIHPFEDGNGRIGRLLVPLFLQSRGVLDRPMLYLSAYLEAHRDTYVHLLKKVSTDASWEEWIQFFLEAIRTQADDARSRIERILSLQARYRAAVTGLPSKAVLPAIDLIMERVFVSVSDVAKYTQAQYATARTAIDHLAKLGVLSPYGRVGGAQVWVAQELLNEAYEIGRASGVGEEA